MSRPGVILRYGRDEADRRAALEQVAALIDAGVVTPVGPILYTHSFLLRGTDAERRMQADAIVAAMRATPGRKGGFYCASMPGTERLKIELEFVPPIPVVPDEGVAPDGIDR